MDRLRPTEENGPGYRLNRTIILVGLMGAGKTSVGRRVAARLGVRFVDSDHEIELAAGMSVPEIFEKYGEPAFRDGERRVIDRLLAQKPHVLATGGGAFIEASTRKVIAERATSVWLRADVEVLWQRVRGKPGRPLLQTPNPRARLEELNRARAEFYALADVTVDSRGDATHEAMAEEIIAAVIAHDAALTDRKPTLETCDPWS